MSWLTLAQDVPADGAAQPATPAPSAPAPAPGIDLGGLGQAIAHAFQDLLNGLPDQIATNGLDLTHQAWSWLNASGLNFLMHSPHELVAAAAGILLPGDLRSIVFDATQTAILLAGVSYVGQYYFNWPGLPETISRIFTTIILTGGAYKLLDLSLEMANSLSEHFGTNMPTPPDLAGVNPLLLLGLIVVWLVLAFRLAFVAGKRIVWLATLYPLIPLATIAAMHPKSAWVASTLWKFWIGLLLGQVILVACLATSVVLTAAGGTAGFILSAASLLVAHDAVFILAPKDGASMSVSVGVGPARFRL